MSNWLPLALLGFVVIVLAAMPWRRPHPNHEFMLHLLRLLEYGDAEVTSSSSSIGRPSNADGEGSSVSSSDARAKT